MEIPVLAFVIIISILLCMLILVFIVMGVYYIHRCYNIYKESKYDKVYPEKLLDNDDY